jgi:hypothetical protein
MGRDNGRYGIPLSTPLQIDELVRRCCPRETRVEENGLPWPESGRSGVRVTRCRPGRPKPQVGSLGELRSPLDKHLPVVSKRLKGPFSAQLLESRLSVVDDGRLQNR